MTGLCPAVIHTLPDIPHLQSLYKWKVTGYLIVCDSESTAATIYSVKWVIVVWLWTMNRWRRRRNKHKKPNYSWSVVGRTGYQLSVPLSSVSVQCDVRCGLGLGVWPVCMCPTGWGLVHIFFITAPSRRDFHFAADDRMIMKMVIAGRGNLQLNTEFKRRLGPCIFHTKF
jgi:hypothetical protein